MPTSPSNPSNPSNLDQPQFDAIIVGAGFGGMGAGIQLKRLGLTNLLILDREQGLGGTWHVNHYPGLAVDIPSSTYSYSFEPNPSWTRLFAPGSELKQYAEHVADTYDLKRHMRFGVSVERAEWDADGEFWRITAADGEQWTARYFFKATGFLSQPRRPDIAGVDDFAGDVVHTSDWDDTVELEGRRIAVIGTGATAVQLIPELAAQASDLTVYQRTAIWVSPKPDLPVPRWLRTVFARVPATQRFARWIGWMILEGMMVGGVLKYRRLSWMNRIAEIWCRAWLFGRVRDRRLRRQLTPDYSFGCKRPTFSNDFHRVFTRDHVHLETTPIERIDGDRIVTKDGRSTQVDVLVLATGFNLWDTNFPAFEVVGRDGVELGAFWRQNRFQAYEGVSVPGFPNFISLNSPYSYSGLSYFTTIECQMTHLQRLFAAMHVREASTFEISQAANDRFLADMTQRLEDSVFVRGNCAGSNSYYFNQHGEATLLRPTSTVEAHRDAETYDTDDYDFR